MISTCVIVIFFTKYFYRSQRLRLNDRFLLSDSHKYEIGRYYLHWQISMQQRATLRRSTSYAISMRALTHRKLISVGTTSVGNEGDGPFDTLNLLVNTTGLTSGLWVLLNSYFISPIWLFKNQCFFISRFIISSYKYCIHRYHTIKWHPEYL